MEVFLVILFTVVASVGIGLVASVRLLPAGHVAVYRSGTVVHGPFYIRHKDGKQEDPVLFSTQPKTVRISFDDIFRSDRSRIQLVADITYGVDPNNATMLIRNEPYAYDMFRSELKKAVTHYLSTEEFSEPFSLEAVCMAAITESDFSKTGYRIEQVRIVTAKLADPPSPPAQPAVPGVITPETLPKVISELAKNLDTLRSSVAQVREQFPDLVGDKDFAPTFNNLVDQLERRIREQFLPKKV